LDTDSLTDTLEALLPKRRDKLISWSFNLLLIMAAVVFVMPLLFWGQSISIQVASMVIYLPDRAWCRMLAVFLFVCWLIYVFTRRILWKHYLMHIHVVVTLLMISLIVISTKWIVPPSPAGPQATLMRTLLEGDSRMFRLNSWKGIVFITVQFSFLVNLCAGMLQKKKKSIRGTGLQNT
jgi:hypothetical protein